MWHRLIPRISRSAPRSFLAIIALAGITFVCSRLQLNISTAGFLYLIVIVLLSLAGDYVSSVVTSVIAALCLAYFFAPPIFSIRVAEILNIVAIVAFLTTSLVISRLVSEVRTRSEKLRLSECYLSEGQRLAHTGSWAFDATGFSYWSPGLFQVHGLDPRRKPPTVEEYLALVYPEDRAFMKQGITQMLVDHRVFDFTKRIVRPDGEIRRIRCVGVPVTQGGIFQGFLGTGMDVTEQERLTEELRLSERYLSEGQRLAHTGSWAFNPSGFFEYWSQELFKIYGLDPQKGAPTLEQYLATVHPQDRDFMADSIKRMHAERGGCDVKKRIVRPDGELRYIRSVGIPVVEGEVLKGFLGTEIDITEQEQLTQELQRREAYLAEAQRLSQTGSFGWKPDSGEIVWSDETYRIFEYDNAVKPTIDSVAQRVHPEDRTEFLKVIDGALKGATHFEHTYRLLLRDGKVKHVHALAHALQDASGNREFVGAATDVSGRKTAEEQLRLSAQELQRSEFYLAEGQRLGQAGSWALNPSGFFEYWSRELFQIYGLDPQKGAPTLEQYLATVHPQDRDFMAETVKRMCEQGSGCDAKKRIIRPDGAVRYVRCVGIPVLDNGVLKRFLGTAMDVTEQEQLTQELQRREAYLAEAQRLSKTGSWAWSPDQDIRYWSEECYRVLSFDPQDGLPRFEEFFQRIHPDDQPGFKELIQTAIREKAEWEADYRIVHPDGPVRDIHVVGHPVLSSSGHLVEFVGTVIDVTERKRAEEERARLRQLEADLAHTNRVSTLGEMAASLAHEIKQPIAAAITSANSCIEWLAHEPPNLDRARAAAARIDKYGNRAAEIIDRIRSLYKKSPPQRELVDVNGIIHEMLTLLKGEANRSSIAMRTDLSAELPKIMVDRVQLQQVFMNLMLNGIEAMEDSGGELTVKSKLQDGRLQFSVSDTGVGLPKEKTDQIFSAFYTTKPQGSGMGLAISRSIVESHGGRLWATATNGRGATFHFTLPTQMTQTSPLVA
jgi:PAS domain S-box-containing protein